MASRLVSKFFVKFLLSGFSFKAEPNPQNFFKNFSIDKTRRRTLNMLMKAYDDGDDDIQVLKRKK